VAAKAAASAAGVAASVVAYVKPGTRERPAPSLTLRRAATPPGKRSSFRRPGGKGADAPAH
jgi:hypothetical protein